MLAPTRRVVAAPVKEIERKLKQWSRVANSEMHKYLIGYTPHGEPIYSTDPPHSYSHMLPQQYLQLKGRMVDGTPKFSNTVPEHAPVYNSPNPSSAVLRRTQSASSQPVEKPSLLGPHASERRAHSADRLQQHYQLAPNYQEAHGVSARQPSGGSGGSRGQRMSSDQSQSSQSGLGGAPNDNNNNDPGNYRSHDPEQPFDVKLRNPREKDLISTNVCNLSLMALIHTFKMEGTDDWGVPEWERRRRRQWAEVLRGDICRVEYTDNDQWTDATSKFYTERRPKFLIHNDPSVGNRSFKHVFSLFSTMNSEIVTLLEKNDQRKFKFHIVQDYIEGVDGRMDFIVKFTRRPPINPADPAIELSFMKRALEM
ncbi:uncharacterized protein LOC135829215 [Sycon ciliatum]|uniref:uncharacterized protein LOC135829215 n=1 Tax=Sycon ciliatum TaxID=27933 RepID=UPI0031F6DF9C